MLNFPNDKRVAVVYLSFHCEPYLRRAAEAWKKINYPKDKLTILLVDNPHPQYGSGMEFIRGVLTTPAPPPKEGGDDGLPRLVFLPQEKNLGFAGGNNVGIKWALDNGFDYVFLHNQDGFMAPDCLTKIVAAVEADKNIGAVQSLVLLYPETNLINTSGNKFHYLGFGFCGDYRKHFCHSDRAERVEESLSIAYASGAAMLLRADLLRQHGGWDEDFFTYHEDLEYSLRLKALGYKIALAPESIFYHQHDFNHNPEKFYFMERNRCGLWLMYFKWPILLLFLPMELLAEVGLFFFALKNGWLKQWGRVYWYWLQPGNWRLWMKKRRKIQALKKANDSDLLASAVGRIDFEGVGGIMLGLANVAMEGYWWVVKRLIRW